MPKTIRIKGTVTITPDQIVEESEQKEYKKWKAENSVTVIFSSHDKDGKTLKERVEKCAEDSHKKVSTIVREGTEIFLKFHELGLAPAFRSALLENDVVDVEILELVIKKMRQKLTSQNT